MIVSVYNQAASIFAQGLSNNTGDTISPAGTDLDPASQYKVKLFSSALTFDATHTTMTQVGGTEVVNAGYTADGELLANVGVITEPSGNDATFDADDFSVTATTNPIDATDAVLYKVSNAATDNVDRPLLHFNFETTETAAAGTDFKIVWSANGIFKFVVAG